MARLLLLGLGLGVWGISGETARAAPPEPVHVLAAWIRVLPGGVPAGGYLTLENRSERAIVLTGISSSAFGEVDLHRTTNEHGLMSMQPVERIRIGPHSTLEFAAHGYHLMLMHPLHPLTPGERVPWVLHFEGAPDLTTAAEVRDHE